MALFQPHGSLRATIPRLARAPDHHQLPGETPLSTNTTLAVLLIAAVAITVWLWLKRREDEPSASNLPWPYFAKRPLSTPEQILYHRLINALPDHFILAQVQVSRVLGVKRGFDFNRWNNRINRLSYDFVVCSLDSTVLAAIELDNSSQARPSSVEVDQRKAKATAAAGIALIRWHVRSLPLELEIQAAIPKRDVPSLDPIPTGEVIEPARARLTAIEP